MAGYMDFTVVYACFELNEFCCNVEGIEDLGLLNWVQIWIADIVINFRR